MKKYLSILLFLSFIILLSSCGKTQTAEKKISVYTTVNGEQIMTDEIDYFRTRYRSQIINDYAEKYGVKDFSEFWDTEFDGKTPRQALEEYALKQAVEAKIKLVLMRENGIYDDISFSALKAKAEKYNKEHENQKGNVGLNTVNMTSFYTYYISNGEMELKNILAESILKPSQAELEAAEKEHPDLTEEGLISMVVTEKYQKMIDEASKNADVLPVKQTDEITKKLS